MAIKHKPFVRQHLEDTGNDLVNVRLNIEERRILDDFKKLIDNKQDSTALKLALLYAHNVIHREFSGQIRIKLLKRHIKKEEIREFERSNV